MKLNSRMISSLVTDESQKTVNKGEEEEEEKITYFNYRASYTHVKFT